MAKPVSFHEQQSTKGKRMNVIFRYGSHSAGARRPARLDRRRRNGTTAVAAMLVSIALLGCQAAEDELSNEPTPSYQETPRTIPGTEPSQETKDFHKYLLANKETKDLTTISMVVKIEKATPGVSAGIITGLDRELRTPDSPDQPRAERLAAAFATWHREKFNDHGTIKIYNPAAETMATAGW